MNLIIFHPRPRKSAEWQRLIFKTKPMFSYITILTPEPESDPNASNLINEGEEDAGSGVDLRTLRAIRVLRPLKLVSGVPSKYKICMVIEVSIQTSRQ